MNYNFEWDPAKDAANRRKHGIGFDDATAVFLDPRALSLYDGRHSETEDRWVTLGILPRGALVVVCPTFREVSKEATTIRIISCRKATKAEAAQYTEQP